MENNTGWWNFSLCSCVNFQDDNFAAGEKWQIDSNKSKAGRRHRLSRLSAESWKYFTETSDVKLTVATAELSKTSHSSFKEN